MHRCALVWVVLACAVRAAHEGDWSAFGLAEVIGFATVGGPLTGGAGGVLRNFTDRDGPDELARWLNETLDVPRVAQIHGIIDCSDFLEWLRPRGDTTLVGAGDGATLLNGRVWIEGVSNVVVRGLRFETSGAARWPEAQMAKSDAVRLVGGAHRVWIDHCTFTRYPDGLVDVTQARRFASRSAVSTATQASHSVTISWCRFDHHDKLSLVGAGPKDVEDVAST
ncbi:pectin lyase fold/virulence factor [Pelagophyceae sp. CCMP2097]|nr:pectin lyase fold/virulence factor [Pelagophyceae sp. CCMP2097]